LLERFVHMSVQGVAVEAAAVDETAVEGREQSPALTRGNLHRPAQRRVRGLVSAGVVGECGACAVEPGDVSHDLRVGELGPERGDQGWWATVERWPGGIPDGFTGKGLREDWLDRRRPPVADGALPPITLIASEPDRRQRLELRATLARGLPGVVDVLGFVHRPVEVVHPQPFDGAHAEREARG